MRRVTRPVVLRDQPRSREYSRAVRTLGPLGYWRLGELSGDALDYSGNNRPGTIAGTGHVRGEVGILPQDPDKAMTLASTARVEVAYAAWQQTQAAFSVIAFVATTAVGGAMVSRRVNGSTPSTAQFSCRGADMVLSNGSVESNYLGVYEPNSASPQMMAWTYDLQTKRAILYSNGLRVFDVYTGVTVGNGGSTPLSIGGLNGGSEYYSNKIDDVAYYGRALTAIEVRSLVDITGLQPVLTNRSLSELYSACTLRIALRSLAGYSGALIDVRRSSDSATRTINATSTGLLDTADMLSWAGSDSVFVSKIYDQSGNGHHFTQGTPSLQPRIVNAGTVETKCGQPVLRFTAQNLDCVNATGGFTDSEACTVLTVYDRTSVVRGRDGFGTGWSVQINPNTISGCVRGGTYTGVLGADNSAAFSVKGYTHNASTLQAPYHGDMQVIRNATNSGAFRSSTKGWGIGNSNGTFVNGLFGELVMWNSAALISEEIKRVTDDMMTYYGSRTLSEKILRDNPVRYFKMDESSGSTATDATGNGNGTYVGSPTLGAAALTSMAGDQSVNFTASLQYIDTNLTTSYNTACSIECVFVGGTQISGGFAHIISKNQYFASGVADFPIKLGINSGLIKYELSSGNDFFSDTSLTFTFVEGVRYHVICTYRASGLCQMIVNGVVVGESIINYTISTTTHEWRIGAATELGPGNGQGMTTFIGRLGHAAIYDHTLSLAQAIEHFQALGQP